VSGPEGGDRPGHHTPEGNPLPQILAATGILLFGMALLWAPGLARAQGVVCSSAIGTAGATATGANATACGPVATASGDSATAVGVNSVASGLESTAEGFNAVADGRGANALGGRNRASATFSTAVGWANTASGLDAFAAGNKSVASGTSTVAVGDVAQATGNLSVAIGAGATASGANSVALGAGSVAADANTVSVGSATIQRRITNVAAGSGATDAVNFGQMQAGFDTLNDRIALVGNQAETGTAVAVAIAGLPQAYAPGKGMISVAIGTWRGQEAFAVGASKVFRDNFVVKAGASFDSHGEGGGNAGVGWQF
jgi:trimeric autotransporter adhesin